MYEMYLDKVKAEIDANFVSIQGDENNRCCLLIPAGDHPEVSGEWRDQRKMASMKQSKNYQSHSKIIKDQIQDTI